LPIVRRGAPNLRDVLCLAALGAFFQIALDAWWNSLIDVEINFASDIPNNCSYSFFSLDINALMAGRVTVFIEDWLECGPWWTAPGGSFDRLPGVAILILRGA
jgi:hypothetical protein